MFIIIKDKDKDCSHETEHKQKIGGDNRGQRTATMRVTGTPLASVTSFPLASVTFSTTVAPLLAVVVDAVVGVHTDTSAGHCSAGERQQGSLLPNARLPSVMSTQVGRPLHANRQFDAPLAARRS